VPGALGWFVGEALGGHGEVGLAVVYGIPVCQGELRPAARSKSR
jgi:hypothetical protein